MATDIILTDLTDGTLTGTGVFDKLMGAVNVHIAEQFRLGRISGPDYANVYLNAMQAVLTQSTHYVMQEKLTEAQADGILADNLLKAKQLEIAEKELLIKAQELLIREQDLLVRKEELELRTAEANRLKDTTEAELEKQWGYDVTRDPVTGELVLGDVTGEGRIDKEIEKMQADIELAQQQVEISRSNNALEKAKAIASIDKEFGFNYTLDENGYIAVGSDAGDGKLDAEVTKMKADADIALEQLSIAKANLALEKAKAVASVSKEYGYEYALDADGNIVIGASTGTGKLDNEIYEIIKRTDIAERGMVEQETTGVKKRILLDTEEEAKQYEVDFMLPVRKTALDTDVASKKAELNKLVEELNVAHVDAVNKPILSKNVRVESYGKYTVDENGVITKTDDTLL